MMEFTTVEEELKSGTWPLVPPVVVIGDGEAAVPDVC
jgi:hypothetical protein